MFCRVGVPYGFYHSHSSKSLKTGSDEWLIFIVFLLFKFPKLHCFSCGVLRAFLVPSISWDHILSSEIMPPKLRARNSVHPRASDPSLGPCCPSDCVQEGWGTVGREYLCDLACHATGHPGMVSWATTQCPGWEKPRTGRPEAQSAGPRELPVFTAGKLGGSG